MKLSLTPVFVLASLSLANAQTVFHIVRTICSVESDPGGGIELDSSIQLLPDNFGCNTHAAAETDDVASWPHVLSFDGNPFGFGPLDFFLDANSGGYFAYHHGQASSFGFPRYKHNLYATICQPVGTPELAEAAGLSRSIGVSCIWLLPLLFSAYLPTANRYYDFQAVDFIVGITCDFSACNCARPCGHGLRYVLSYQLGDDTPMNEHTHLLADTEENLSPGNGRYDSDNRESHSGGVSYGKSCAENSDDGASAGVLSGLGLRVSLLLENRGTTARDHLASERTFLAYLRTSLALAAGGVVMGQLLNLPGSVFGSYARPLAASCIVLALYVLLVGITRYFTVQNELVKGVFTVARFHVGVIALALAGIVSAILVLLARTQIETPTVCRYERSNKRRAGAQQAEQTGKADWSRPLHCDGVVTESGFTSSFK
ncbi:hypothetical protein R3P38DRAFT_2788994 [Favolaschia claudopus]|uniref:DUF202 domain-containing protein n=1 Tax=Favolaschia claudopus TaxID=2862362 RepID=A0AAW0AKU4_9AGAR